MSGISTTLFIADESAGLPSAVSACARADDASMVVFGTRQPRRRPHAGWRSAQLRLTTAPANHSPARQASCSMMLLAELGVHRRDMWITNLVRCFDGHENGRQGEPPGHCDSEIRHVGRGVTLELRFVNPKRHSRRRRSRGEVHHRPRLPAPGAAWPVFSAAEAAGRQSPPSSRPMSCGCSPSSSRDSQREVRCELLVADA